MIALTIYIAILAFLSLSSSVAMDSTIAFGFVSWDMLDHAAAYGGLAVLLMFIVKRYQTYTRATLWVILMCGTMGMLMEYCQLWFTETRQFSLHDAGANVFGSMLGVAVFWGYALLFNDSFIGMTKHKNSEL